MIPGDAQTSVYVLRNQQIPMPPGIWLPLFLDGIGQQITIAPNRTVMFDILVTGRELSPLGTSAGWTIRGVVKEQAGLAVMVGVPVITQIAADAPVNPLGWNVNAVVAGNALVILVFNGNNPVPIRWVATVRTAEVKW